MIMGESSSRTAAPRFARLANLAGVGGVLAIILGMVVAAVAYEGTVGQSYRVANHFVSELGEIGISRSAWAFNGGLIAGGIGILVFPIGIASRMNGWFRWIVGPVGLLTGVFGTLVGVFPMNNLAVHMFVANGFFYPGLATMLLFSGYVLTSRHREFPRWIAVPGLVAAGALFAFLFLGGLVENLVNSAGPPPGFGVNRPAIWVSALFEWVAICAILVWVATVGVILTARDHLSE